MSSGIGLSVAAAIAAITFALVAGEISDSESCEQAALQLAYRDLMADDIRHARDGLTWFARIKSLKVEY